MWGGPIRWLLMGHWFTTEKRREVIRSGIHSNDVARASDVARAGIVRSVAG